MKDRNAQIAQADDRQIIANVDTYDEYQVHMHRR